MQVFWFCISLFTTCVVCNPSNPRREIWDKLIGNIQPTSATVLPTHNSHIWQHSGAFEGDIMVADGVGPRNVRRTGRWPKGVVPYEMQPGVFSQKDISIIKEVMKYIENLLPASTKSKSPCQIKFVPRDKSHTNYIRFMSNGPGICTSYVGVVGGRQDVSFGAGCIDKGVIKHELLHALGLEHQHTSPNRDDYIEVVWENLDPRYKVFYEKKETTDYTTLGLPYDFDSIMQYTHDGFSIQTADGKPVGPTLKPRDPKVDPLRWGNKQELSEMDKLKLKMMYCPERFPTPR